MYKAFYNLNEMPFDQSVDPEYTWLGKKHSAALLSIKKDFLDKKGLFLVTGEAGTGKTSLVKRFLAEIDSDKIVVTVTDPDLDELDFFNWLSVEFSMNVMFKSKGAFLTRFKRFLLDAYQKKIKIILIIDDAHRVNQELLEAVMILANIEKDGEKLLSIFFIGQPGFNEILQEEHNLALKQSICSKYHLEPLQKDEVIELILYRLGVAGAKTEIFSSNAYDEIYLFSAGYPRMVVNICDRALIAGCVRSTHIINKELIVECGRDLQIAGVQRKIEGENYQGNNYEAGVYEENEDGQPEAESNNLPAYGLLTRIFPIVRTSIFPVLLALLIVVGIYLLYYFKPSFLSWASLNLNQEKSASLPDRQFTSTGQQKTQKASDNNLAFTPNDNGNSINTNENQTEFADEVHGRVDRDPDDKKILPEDTNTPVADESFDTPPDVDDLSGVIADSDNGSLPVKSNESKLDLSAPGNKMSELNSEESAVNIDQLPPAKTEIGSENKTIDQKIESPVRRLDLKLKPLEKDWQDVDVKLARLEPETQKIGVARPANNLKARRDVQLSYSGLTKLRPLEKERQDADIKTVHLEPRTLKPDVAQPAGTSEENIDVQSSRSPESPSELLKKEQEDTGLKSVQFETEKKVGSQLGHDTGTPEKIKPLQPVAVKPSIKAPPVKPELDPIKEPEQTPGIEIANLGRTTGQEEFSSRPKLKERVQAFLEGYCKTYEAKDLDHFATFFTPDAEENDKPFHALLPKYRRNFNAIEFITYRIELQNYEYDEQNKTVKIDGKFFLEWLPGGAEWRRNSGKIFMELIDFGSSYKISRLEYYGDRKKTITRNSN